MSWRFTITMVCALVLCLQAGALTTGVSAPAEDGSSTLELAAAASHAIDPALILARHGEALAAYGLADTDPGATAFRVRLLAEMKRYREADSLLSLHTPIDGGRALYLHQLQRAVFNLLAGRFDAALEALAPVASHQEPDLDAYRDFVAMRAYLSLESPEAAARVGNDGHERGVPDALRDEYEETLLEACQAAGDDTRALELIKGLQSRAHGWRDKARHLHNEYEFYARALDLDAARRVARVLVTTYPGYDRTGPVADEIGSNVDAASMSVAELAAYATFYTSRARFDEAAGLLGEMGRRPLNASQREHHRLLRAEYHYRAGNYEKAATLARPAFDVPAYKRRSILVLARSYRRTNREAKAAALYEYFARTFPNDGKSAEALFVAARTHERSGDEAAYRRAVDHLIRAYPSSYHGRAAVLMSVKSLSDRGEHDAAAEVLSRIVKRSRGTDESALYYLSRAYDATGDEQSSHMIIKELESVDPFSFYLKPGVPGGARAPAVSSSGALALDGERGLIEFLERGNRERVAAYGRIRAGIADGGVEIDSTFAGCVERGRWLLSVGLREWGESELETARRRCFDSPASMLELGRVYDEFAMPWQSVRMYQRVMGRMPWSRRGEFAHDFRWLLYPTPYPVQVLKNSTRYNVPPHLAYAMIREESRFDLDAVSHVGALGLMQIMPETGRGIARELELPGWVEEDLLIPEVNVAFGVWYASSLLEASSGDPLWMLAAYNAGPGNARRWFHDGEDGDPIDVVDNIDFKETRLYVQRIVESANIYHSLYFGPDAMGAEPPR